MLESRGRRCSGRLQNSTLDLYLIFPYIKFCVWLLCLLQAEKRENRVVYLRISCTVTSQSPVIRKVTTFSLVFPRNFPSFPKLFWVVGRPLVDLLKSYNYSTGEMCQYSPAVTTSLHLRYKLGKTRETIIQATTSWNWPDEWNDPCAVS